MVSRMTSAIPSSVSAEHSKYDAAPHVRATSVASLNVTHGRVFICKQHFVKLKWSEYIVTLIFEKAYQMHSNYIDKLY